MVAHLLPSLYLRVYIELRGASEGARHPRAPGRYCGAAWRPAPFGRSAEQARFPALELSRSIGYGPAPESSRKCKTTRGCNRGSWEAFRIGGVSAIQFDHQWEDIDVEA
jgi:hypothetical protein